MHQDKKSDTEISTALKQVELSQELTRSRMNGLIVYAPGPMSTEQIFVLEAKSATLIPPESDLPSTPAPDPAAQKAILDKAAAYVTSTYAQVPSLTATKTTLRFQDNVEALASSSGLQGGATDVVVSSGFSKAASFVHYINSAQSQISIQRGVEKWQAPQQKIPWGANKMIALQEPGPNMPAVFHATQNFQAMHWLRWETVNGKPAAVFAFEAPHNKSHMSVDVCCFPKINQTGVANFYTSTTASTLGGGASGGGGVSGNFQTNTKWYDYKTAAPYHGELFVDPQTGVVVRMIVEADLNPSEVVHDLATRTDFGPVPVGAKMYMLPVKTYIDSLVVPNGDSGAASYTTRRTLFTSEYRDYEPGPK